MVLWLAGVEMLVGRVWQKRFVIELFPSFGHSKMVKSSKTLCFSTPLQQKTTNLPGCLACQHGRWKGCVMYFIPLECFYLGMMLPSFTIKRQKMTFHLLVHSLSSDSPAGSARPHFTRKTCTGSASLISTNKSCISLTSTKVQNH